MNLYVTHSDENYVSVAEKLFDSLKLTSTNNIIYYTGVSGWGRGQ
jgi:hypothetical protein